MPFTTSDPFSMVSIPHRQATNKTLHMVPPAAMDEGFNSSQVGYKQTFPWLSHVTRLGGFNSSQVGYKQKVEGAQDFLIGVSIPHRQATNVRKDSLSAYSCMFQFLIGRLQTPSTLAALRPAHLFQFLIGRLQTCYACDILVAISRFNSSQVGYKHMGLNRKSPGAMKVSIPHRQATNRLPP